MYVCFVIVYPSSLVHLMPWEAMLRNRGISWVSSLLFMQYDIFCRLPILYLYL